MRSLYIYPEDTLDRLDFTAVTDILVEFCKGEQAKLRCKNMKFFFQKERVERMLQEVNEAMFAIIEQSTLPIGQYEDISEDLYLLQKQNYVLDIESIVRIISQVRIVNELDKYAKGKNFKEQYPILQEILDQIDIDQKLISTFDSIFAEDYSIRSDASPQLKKIIARISRKERDINKIFDSISSQYQKSGFLTDNKESYRNGRRVLSVLAENKRKIEGIIHDESSSGKTVFIEPQELTVLHNDLYDLESEKRQEIYRIIKALCEQLRPQATIFELWQKIIIRLDFIQAKAKLAILLDANKPKVNSEGNLILKTAYNPYLKIINDKESKPTIPFDLEITNNERIVIISGPNAGGKSVTMKAVGTILLMVHCGLLPPVDADSDILLCRKILCDIGDQQSVADDLSTYSSRLTNMKHFLEKADKQSFMLIDEFGSGTDPKVGGALAEGVLVNLHGRKVKGLITTHYSNIKMFGYETNGISNAAMIFDQKELAPTYQMRQGKPGSSFAFEIANKLGLPKNIIEYAKKKSGKNTKAVDDLLSDLQKERKELEKKLSKAESEKAQLQRLLDQYHVLHNEYEFKKQKLKSEIKENTFRKLEDERRELNNLIKELRKEKNLELATERLDEVKLAKEEVFEEIQEIESKMHKATEVHYKQLREGDYIKLKKSGLIGKILDIDRKKYQLEVGDLVMHVKEKDIIPSRYEPIEQHTAKPVKTVLTTDLSSIESKLDIRGYRKSEAEAFLSEFLDNAFLSNFDMLTIIHGVGSGVLRKTVYQKLKEYEGIKKVWSPEDEFGGKGVTYIEI